MALQQANLLGKKGYGLQSLICLLFAISAGLGLWVLESQVQVFSFGDSLFDAQFFPRIVLSLIVAVSVLCFIARMRKEDQPIGPFSNLVRVVIAGSIIAVALWYMPVMGFLLATFIAASVTALLFGERHMVFFIGLPLFVSALVTFGAQQGLNIPLP